MRETVDEAIGIARESKRLHPDKENSDQKEEQLASLFGQNHTPNPQYAPESLGIDPELQICHEIICKAFVFEKNRTARIPVSGVERYGAPKLWSVARCYARRRHNGFSTPNLLRVPGKKLGLGVGLGGEEKQGEIRSQLKAAPPHY